MYTILICDDDKDIVSALDIYLTSEGYRTLKAYNGREAIRAVEQMAHYLSIWIFNVYMLLNIDCIVFSGGLLAMGDKLFGRMKEEFERYHTNEFPVEFFQTELGSDSGLIGAVELLFD